MTTNRPQANNLLRRDVRFLGTYWRSARSSGRNELLETVEKIREMSKSLRAEFMPELYEEFKQTIDALELRKFVIR